MKAAGPKQTISAEDERIHKEQHDLERIIHPLLIAGVIVSSTLLLVGLLLVLFNQGSMPTELPAFGQVILQVMALEPAGFFALGLLVLISTPILRVVLSVVGFLIERDFRFALITFVVLIIILASIFLGEG